MQDLVDACRPALELKGIHLALELAPGLPAAWIDPLQAERCLANLLDNAIKYTPQGGTVTCRTERSGARLVATVGDSGPGVPPDRRATLFSRFQDGTDAGGRRSTGLGLHIAHALAQSLGGDLSLDASPPHGAWFRVHLPAAADGDGAAATATAAPAAAPQPTPPAALHGRMA